jgi:hypothetical protein
MWKNFPAKILGAALQRAMTNQSYNAPATGPEKKEGSSDDNDKAGH